MACDAGPCAPGKVGMSLVMNTREIDSVIIHESTPHVEHRADRDEGLAAGWEVAGGAHLRHQLNARRGSTFPGDPVLLVG
jgi:hypothetical protein